MNIQKLFSLLNRRLRARRMTQFETLFGLNENTTVLDVGGALGIWASVTARPNVTILNLRSANSSPGCLDVIGDGTMLPFADQSFDVVFSNSVIEHVGRIEKQQSFAKEVMRVGRRFYVQTPNRWFPVEPHLLTPLIHFIPVRVRRHLLRNFTVWGLMTRPSREYVRQFVESTRLISARELSAFFPTAELHRERFVGLTKSLIMVQTKTTAE